MKKSFRLLSVLTVFLLSAQAYGRSPIAFKGADDQSVSANSGSSRTQYLKSLRSQAMQGSAEAQLQLATLYEHGSGTAQNLPEAIHWYTQAANQGSAPAQFQLGRIFEEGRGSIKKDLAYALSWYEEAARNGFKSAARKLRTMQRTDQ